MESEPQPRARGGDGHVESFRRTLRLETERLRIRHRLGLGGAEIAGGRSEHIEKALLAALARAGGGTAKEAR